MAYNQDAPVFADRYRFEPVGKDWDVGRSGYTHLVYDLRKNRHGVIKRAEVNSKQAVDLGREIEALKKFQGLGVPAVYETGQAIYGSKNYVYVVLEYIDAVRVERNLNLFSIKDRAEILSQFFEILANAHQKGIVNGDVDLKHLFWNAESRRLIVIDWGNAKLNVDPKKQDEFSYDLARSAEIIYSLVTDKEHPPATGPLTLPGMSAVLPGIRSLPREYLDLCQWAPRKPADGIKSPFTASQMLDITKQWNATITGNGYKKAPRYNSGRLIWAWISIIVIALLAITAYFQRDNIRALISSPTLTASQTPSVTATVGISLAETSSSTPVAPTQVDTPTTTVPPTLPILDTATFTPSPTHLPYSPILAFDQKPLPPEKKSCWRTETELTNLTVSDGFYLRSDNNWGFRVLEDEKNTIAEERPVDTPIYIDFSQCSDINQVTAMGINAWVIKLVPERINPAYAPSMTDPGREFGFFVQGKNGIQREYTLWIDAQKILHLKVRENGEIIDDNSELVVSTIQTDGAFPRTYNKFFIQIFLELNNNGTDALYLLQGSGKAVDADSLDPAKMILKSTLPTVGDFQKIGLVGYGGETQVVIWPLVFYTQE